MTEATALPTHEERIARALALLVAGEADEGLALYRSGLANGRLPDAPVGMHLLFLEKAGRRKEAAALRRLALDEGADLAVKAGGFGTAPEEAAREYEALIDAGAANSRMIWEYLLILSRLGGTEEVAALLAPDLLLRQVPLDVDAEAVAAFLLREEAAGTWQEETDSVRRMTKIKRLQRFEDEAVRALTTALRSETAAYLADWRASSHRLARLVPAEFGMHLWGLVSRGEGYNIRHIHHRGWATGIYYPANLAGEAGGGALRIGCPARLGEIAPGWPDISIAPEAGLLVLMPSFYTHWTTPLGRPGLRLSVAFDLTPGEERPSRSR